MEKQLPKNWVELKLESLFYLYYGKGLSTKELLDEGYNVYGANGIIGKYNKYNQENSKVIISCRGANSGVMHFTNPKSFVTSNSIVLDEISEKITNKMFAFYIMQAIDKTVVITGTAQPQITIQLLKNLLFPLPPLPEQNRIVAKLDSLFAELDTIKERLANIPSLLKNFRQSVLNQAVTGKLTEEWRTGKELVNLKLESNGKYELGFNFRVPENWKVYPIGNVFSFQQGMQIAKNTRLKESGNNRLPILRIKNYHDGFIKDVEYVSITEKSLIAEKEDIILTRTGESRGWVLTGYRGVFHNNTFRINFPKDKVEGRYLEFFLNQSEVQSFIKFNSGRTGQPDLTHKSFGPCPFILPPQEEQTEIVKRVDSLFNQADNIQAHYEALVKQIEILPQAILAKAFRGELVPQLPTDGDAKELLAKIKKLKEAAAPKRKKRVVKK